MIINISYDSTVANAPAGYKTAIAAAVQFLDQTFVNNVTVNIQFGWGEAGGTALDSNASGENITSGSFYTYSQFRNALVANATSATDAASMSSLPVNDPTNGGRFFVSQTEAAMLHLSSATAINASVGLNSSLTYTFDPANRAVAGEYDAIGILEHEITEVMGRVGDLGIYFDSSSRTTYGPMDLFRYSAPGVRDFAGHGYFSVDGQTLSTQFNDPRNGGDVADWLPSISGDVFGSSHLGVAEVFTATDYNVMDVLGYRLAPAASQTFVSTSANEIFNGGAAVDTAVYHGTRSQYSVNENTNGVVTVADSVANRDGTDTLVSVEQVKFTDGTVVFDLQSSQDKLTYEIYQASFGRMPDLAGFRYWAGVADANQTSGLQLADAFLAAPEYAQKYGNPNDQTYVNELYTNVLGRAPDSAGLAYWVSRANAGEPRDQLLLDFATSPENMQLVAPEIAHGYWVI